jgi:iron complex transport system substrate-binding protein
MSSCTLPRLRYIVMFLLLTFIWNTTAHGREITDMAGRRVVVPETIRTVCADWAPVEYLLYALDPTLLAAVSVPFRQGQKAYLHPHVRSLPATRAYLWGGSTTNIETLLKIKPDVVIAEMSEDRSVDARSVALLASLRIPIVYVRLDDSKDYPNAFEFLGNLLGRQKRGHELATYGRAAFKDVEHFVSALPKDKRPRVYYAQGPTGLQTECHTSFHAELIEMAGAINVHQCPGGGYKVRGMNPVNMEKVMVYDPDVIITADRMFYDAVLKDSRWFNIKAVRTGKVFLTPQTLFNWFDRPPSFMRLLGIRWLVWRLYEGSYSIDMVREAQTFYRLFLGLDIPEETIRKDLGLER